MEEEEEQPGYGPGKGAIVVISVVALLIPILIASVLVFGLTPQPTPYTQTSSGTAAQSVSVLLPDGVGNPSSGLNYQPANITVVIGVNNTVVWTDQDAIPHTVTSVSVPTGASSFDSGTMQKGSTFAVTLTVPGVYDYHCTFHPGWMKGQITVLGPSGAASTSQSTAPPTSQSASPISVKVTLPKGVGNPSSGLNYQPANITVVIGVNNTVVWTDLDTIPHTVTSTSVPAGASSFDSGTMQLNQQFTVTFTVPGVYKYHCTFHPGWMIGQVVVKK